MNINSENNARCTCHVCFPVRLPAELAFVHYPWASSHSCCVEQRSADCPPRTVVALFPTEGSNHLLTSMSPQIMVLQIGEFDSMVNLAGFRRSRRFVQ